MSEIDWAAIQDDYERGLSLRALATKYNVSKTVIGDRKYQEKWEQTKRTDKRTILDTQEVIHPDMNAAVRAAHGFKLRYQQHKTWDEVAAGAGYASRGAARNAVQREAHRHLASDIQEIRSEEFYRINQLQARCYDAGTDMGNDDWTWAIDRFVLLSKRKSELMDLDKHPEESTGPQVIIEEMPAGYLEGPKE